MSTSPATAERTPRGQGDRLRERLVDAALALLDEHGDESQLSIRAVTKRTGVSPTAFYLHFEQRDELLQACLARCFEEFRDAMRAGVADSGDPVQRVTDTGLAYMGFAAAKPARYALIFGPSSPARATDEEPYEKPSAAEEAFDDLTSVVEGYLGDDDSRRADVDIMARGVWIGLHGFVTLRRARPAVKWPTEEEFVRRLALAWLGDPPDGP